MRGLRNPIPAPARVGFAIAVAAGAMAHTITVTAQSVVGGIFTYMISDLAGGIS